MESCAACVLLAAALLFTVVSVYAESSTSSGLAQWKNQLEHFRQWEGHFVYLNVSHSCQMTVHSVQQGSAGGAMVTFTADHTKLDMSAYSSDDISIHFRTETAYHLGSHFYEGFAFVVEMVQYGNYHKMMGNITHPASNVSTIELHRQGSVTNHHGSSDLSIGLAVGISLFLFVVCTVIGVAILRWAINKGYLRHVAMSYKNFRNPEPAAEPPVSFSTDQQQDTNPDHVNVHI